MSTLKKGDEKEFQSHHQKKGTTQPCKWGVNVVHEKSLGNCLYNGVGKS